MSEIENDSDGTPRQLIKASGAIAIGGDITLFQRRLWNVLLYSAYNDLPHKSTFEISMQDLLGVIKVDASNAEYIRNSLRELMGHTVPFNVFEKDNGVDWSAAVLIADVAIEGNNVTYSYAPRLQKILYNPKMYAKINLSIQSRLKSKYSTILYELASDYLDEKRGKGETPYLSLDMVRTAFGATVEYTQYKYFKNRVLKIAISEVNDKTDYDVEILERRKARAVTEVKFRFSLKNGVVTDDDLGPWGPSKSGEKPGSVEMGLFDDLLSICHFPELTARKYLNIYDHSILLEVVEIVRMASKKKSIKSSITGYAYKVLENVVEKHKSESFIDVTPTASKDHNTKKTNMKERLDEDALMKQYRSEEKKWALQTMSTLDYEVQKDLIEKATERAQNKTKAVIPLDITKDVVKIELVVEMKNNGHSFLTYEDWIKQS